MTNETSIIKASTADARGNKIGGLSCRSYSKFTDHSNWLWVESGDPEGCSRNNCKNAYVIRKMNLNRCDEFN